MVAESSELITPAPMTEEGPPSGPSVDEEEAFLAEQATSEGTLPVPAAASPTKNVEAQAPLPPLDQLVKRISPDIRATLDELFRAKFVEVRRVPSSAYKS